MQYALLILVLNSDVQHRFLIRTFESIHQCIYTQKIMEKEFKDKIIVTCQRLVES